MDSSLAFVACMKFLMFISFVTVSDNLETESLIFGNDISVRHFRTITGIPVRACIKACKSRGRCKAIQYNRHAHICMLPRLSPQCGSCPAGTVCQIDGSTHSCIYEECPTSPTDTGAFYGNIVGIGSKMLVERQCYSLYSGGTSSELVQQTCLNNGTWESSQDSCFPSYESFIDYQGCKTDSNERILSHLHGKPKDTTIETCAVSCFQNNYAYFGVEDGKACHCGNTVQYDHGPSTNCKKACGGDASVTCGGRWSLQLYTYRNV